MTGRRNRRLGARSWKIPLTIRKGCWLSRGGLWRWALWNKYCSEHAAQTQTQTQHKHIHTHRHNTHTHTHTHLVENTHFGAHRLLPLLGAHNIVVEINQHQRFIRCVNTRPNWPLFKAQFRPRPTLFWDPPKTRAAFFLKREVGGAHPSQVSRSGSGRGERRTARSFGALCWLWAQNAVKGLRSDKLGLGISPKEARGFPLEIQPDQSMVELDKIHVGPLSLPQKPGESLTLPRLYDANRSQVLKPIENEGDEAELQDLVSRDGTPP